jgi:hypothetical protein
MREMRNAYTVLMLGNLQQKHICGEISVDWKITETEVGNFSPVTFFNYK